MNQSTALATLRRYIMAKYPIIAILSHEESRVLSGIKAIAEKKAMQFVPWTVTGGLKGEGFASEKTRDPIPAFKDLLAHAADPCIFVMQDLHGLLGNKDRGFDPILTRYLRDTAAAFESGKSTLILLSPNLQVPPDLEKVIALIDWPLPDNQELDDILKRAEDDLDGNRIKIDIQDRSKVIQSMRGLTAFEANQVLAAGIISAHKLDDEIIPYIVREKIQIIKKSGVLEYFDTDVTMNQVGGLQYLKSYADVKRAAFSSEAAEYGVDPPKGVLLVGIPGTGKSLAAKAIAGGQMPLLRMDIGALMGGLVGQSEGNMRAALKVATAVAPCVLWLDEIEKSIGGSGLEMDGGTISRVFGTLLTWMQENDSPVYVVATANDIRSLRPELIRRFDDMFWLDLPCKKDRIEILSVHLTKRGHSLFNLDLEKISDATWGFSGGEIEKTVKSAIEVSFFRNEPLSTDGLISAAKAIIPIRDTMKNQIEDLRKQAGTAKIAGDPLEPQHFSAGGSSNNRFADI